MQPKEKNRSPAANQNISSVCTALLVYVEELWQSQYQVFGFFLFKASYLSRAIARYTLSCRLSHIIIAQLHHNRF